MRTRFAVGDSYLTPAEYRVMAMYIDGVSRSDMPNKLACSIKTVDTHLQAAKHRIGAKTIHQLIAMVAVADQIRGRGRTSNRDIEGGSGRTTVLEPAHDCVDALTVNIGPGAAPKPRSLTFPTT